MRKWQRSLTTISSRRTNARQNRKTSRLKPRDSYLFIRTQSKTKNMQGKNTRAEMRSQTSGSSEFSAQPLRVRMTLTLHRVDITRIENAVHAVSKKNNMKNTKI